MIIEGVPVNCQRRLSECSDSSEAQDRNWWHWLVPEGWHSSPVLSALSVLLTMGGLCLLALPARTEPIRPPQTCPSDLETLVDWMLPDLPAYANRVIQRSSGLYRDGDRPGYILLAGRPEFEPLTLGPGVYQPVAPGEVNEDEPLQVFFTTLNRQYVEGETQSLQHFHWVFLVRPNETWRLALMVSTLGEAPPGEPPTPPYDSSQGAIAQAIRLWLRDCEAGAVVGE